MLHSTAALLLEASSCTWGGMKPWLRRCRLVIYKGTPVYQSITQAVVPNTLQLVSGRVGSGVTNLRPQGWKETSLQEPLWTVSPGCPGPSSMFPISSTLPCAAPRPQGVTARSSSCPQRPLPCPWHVSCGLVPSQYSAAQVKNAGCN